MEYDISNRYRINDHEGKNLFSIETHNLDNSWPLVPHTHHRLEISCVKSGTGTYLVDGRRYEIAKGDVFLFNNQETHYISLKPGESMRHLVIHFSQRFIWNALANDLDYNFLSVFFQRNSNFENRLDRNNPSTKKVYKLLHDLDKESLSNHLAKDLRIKVIMESILIEITENYPYIAAITSEKVLPARDTKSIENALIYIDQHLCEDMTLAELAEIGCMSPAYFSSFFKKCNGIAPFEYIARKRVQMAIEQIRNTSKNLTEIATLCGFNNSTSFLKTFKKITGNPPSYYRNK